MQCLLGAVRPPHGFRGFTLLELVMVIILIGILAAVAVRGVDHSFDRARFEATVAEMDELARALVGDPRLVNAGARADFGFVGDMGRFPTNLDELVNDAGGTWNGPYVGRGFSQDSLGHKTDAWGDPYLYPYGGDQVVLCSSGNGDSVTLRVAPSSAAALSNTVRGTVTDANNSPPSAGDLANVAVTIEYPQNGSMTSSQANPLSGGGYQFAGIPIGNHRMSAAHSTLGDSVVQYVSVTPGNTVTVNFRFASTFPGGGGGGGSFTYVAGSAQSFGAGRRHVEFQIENSSGGSASFDDLTADYTSSPTAYYEEFKLDGSTCWQSTNPRAASGDTITFATQTASAGQTMTLQLLTFVDSQTGGGSTVNMINEHFTVTLSDGSVIEFDT